ncbi:hypothetical protein HNY73_006993 [Argiope bruennichi]|uniref:Spidroin C-terminal domain-containing protein n=1 Tax=Argiope bruennichi TaxID=94029 RepID=A0A8T0FDM3_ARGBR|nr:hypothetical protein HNY73_006993 [Argiope bruennichi]
MKATLPTLGPRVLSAVLQGVSRAGEGLGINVDTSSVENDISSSTRFSFRSSSNKGSVDLRYTGAQSDPFQGNPFSVNRQALEDQLKNKMVLVEQLQRHPDPCQDKEVSVKRLGFPHLLKAKVFSVKSSGSAISTCFWSWTMGRTALKGALNSPIGLRSGSAASRINQLTSSLTNSIGPNGVDTNALARSLQSSFSNLRSSGMSSSDAKIEVLLESIVGLLQLLSNTQIRGVNPATASSVANSAARSFELVLA